MMSISECYISLLFLLEISLKAYRMFNSQRGLYWLALIIRVSARETIEEQIGAVQHAVELIQSCLS